MLNFYEWELSEAYSISEEDIQMEQGEDTYEYKVVIQRPSGNIKVGSAKISGSPHPQFPDFLQLQDAFVRNEFRKKGVFSKLVQRAAIDAGKNGYKGLVSTGDNRTEGGSASLESMVTKGSANRVGDGAGTIYFIPTKSGQL